MPARTGLSALHCRRKKAFKKKTLANLMIAWAVRMYGGTHCAQHRASSAEVSPFQASLREREREGGERERRERESLVAEWTHFTLFGIILPL